MWQFRETIFLNGHKWYSRKPVRTVKVSKEYTDKKENQIFFIYKEIQSGAVAKSYMRKGFLIYEEMRKYFPQNEEAVSHKWLCNCSTLNFIIYEENLNSFFISVAYRFIKGYIHGDIWESFCSSIDWFDTFFGEKDLAIELQFMHNTP